MTIFLRNKKNESVVDIEVNNGEKGPDLRSAVIIETYSQVLLDNVKNSKQVIADFTEIDELRGWFWEVYMEDVDVRVFKLSDVIKKIILMLNPIAERYKLEISID